MTTNEPEVVALDMIELDMTELHKLLMILRSTIMWTLDDEEEELAMRAEKAIAALAAYRQQRGDT